jgi:electron transfer flavoprotein alpha subunit
LRVAALVKQVPIVEQLTLGPDGRLVRHGLELEMNAYCRRAVSKGVELARDSGGSCTVFTLGPPSAEDVLREAVAWGADDGVHLCDPAFAGSDTLATARALASALRAAGPFDLVLVGRNSIDSETGQVGPELAQLLDLPFATGVRVLELFEGTVAAELQLDDGIDEVEIDLPVVLSVAERLCEPCKVDPAGRAAVPADRIRRVDAASLGSGPWGDDGSPTVVGAVRPLLHHRSGTILSGDLETQVASAVDALVRSGALTPALADDAAPSDSRTRSSAPSTTDGPAVIAVVVEHDRVQAACELIGAAARLAVPLGAQVTALCPEGGPLDEMAGAGADEIVQLLGSRVAEDVADGLLAWVDEHHPWAVVAPSTAFGREVAARVAAARDAGLVGDAIALEVVDGTLVAAKPAFSGALVADITCRSALQLITVRPGVLPVPAAGPGRATVTTRHLASRGRVRVMAERRDDDIETLARAQVVIGVGTGVQPDEYELLSPLAAVLGAELGATRKVTDKGWAPRSRQIGITGRALSPRLYVAIGLSGKFNHIVGVRTAGTILAINQDGQAPVFEHCDIGIVGDWHQVLPLLTDALRRYERVHS